MSEQAMQEAQDQTLLVGDIGGTNCRLALVRREDGELKFLHRAVLPTAGQSGLVEAVENFLKGEPAPTHAGFAIAGPVTGETVALTNSHWRFARAEVKNALGLTRLVLANDLAAQAEALLHLRPDEIASLGGGELAVCNRLAVIGLGTGLGAAAIVRDPSARAKILPTEAGHAGFAAFDDLDLEVLEIVRAELGRVVCEHLVSGPGLERLYRALCQLRGRPWLPNIDGREIVRRAVARDDQGCVEAAARFALALASVSADVALMQGADGVILVGDLAVSLLPELSAPAFRARFEQHGPGRGYFAKAPIGVALAKDIGLRGAFHVLERDIQESQ